MRITNKIEYSDKLIVLSTSYPDDNFPNYDKYGLNVPIKDTYYYSINMSFNSKFQASWHYPTTETIGLQAINTLTVVDKIFSHIREGGKLIAIVNCDAGVNRSYNVVECFNYLKTGEDEYLIDRNIFITDFLKRVENRENIELVIYSYISKLVDNGILIEGKC